MDFYLDLTLFSKTPVVDYELIPKAQLMIKKELTPSKKDLSKPDNYSFTFKWYRSKKRSPFCCVHGSKFGTIQCIGCAKYGLPVEESWHCSAECYRKDWKKHRVRHLAHLAVFVDDSKSKLDNDGKTIYPQYYDGSWPSFSSASQSVSESSDTSIEGGESWSEIGSSETYKPTLDDFGYRLKLQSQAVDGEGIPLTQTEVIVTDHIIIAPDPCPRQMIPVGSNLSMETQSRCAGTFRILTYNVLVDYLGFSLYPYCPTWALTWEYRRRNLLREIIEYDADILCLQEVQNDYFENFFRPELAKLGYSVSYKKKTSVIFTGKHSTDGYSTDGCATFFRDNRFIHIKTSEVEFRKKANSTYQNLSQQQKKTTESYRWLKDNIAVVVKLKDIKNGTVFCVANTHILADPKAKDVKVWQVATLINELEEICDSNIPVLVCADLNSLPRSAPHDLVVRGSVDHIHEDFKDTSMAMFEHLKLYHRMRLVSAYSSILNNTGDILISEAQRDKMDPETNEPFFTNFTLDFAGAIDYIFYQEEAFTVKHLLELVDRQSVEKDKALPSPCWSSDHIALMAEFCIKPQNMRSSNVRK